MKKVKLDELKKIETPFQVPVAYFQKLENQIQERVSERKKGITANAIRWSLIPAMLVIVISGVLILKNLHTTAPNAKTILAEVSNDDILSYLAFTEISENEIVTLADQDILLPENQDYLEDIEIGEEDLDILIDQLEIESEYL